MQVLKFDAKLFPTTKNWTNQFRGKKKKKEGGGGVREREKKRKKRKERWYKQSDFVLSVCLGSKTSVMTLEFSLRWFPLCRPAGVWLGTHPLSSYSNDLWSDSQL